jgi:hypothetical protein
LEVNVLKRFVLAALVAVVCIPSLLHAENKILAELKIVPASGAEKNAGVWVDGQYLGYVKELKGNKKILLMPGKHELTIREPWYKDDVEELLLEPGEVHAMQLSLVRNDTPADQSATAELKIDASPDRAAVFVDEQFLGHVDQFGGGRAMLLIPGSHKIRIALPGYEPFETVVSLRDHQKMKIQTTLLKGSITEAGRAVGSK